MYRFLACQLARRRRPLTRSVSGVLHGSNELWMGSSVGWHAHLTGRHHADALTQTRVEWGRSHESSPRTNSGRENCVPWGMRVHPRVAGARRVTFPVRARCGWSWTSCGLKWAACAVIPWRGEVLHCVSSERLFISFPVQDCAQHA